MSNRVDHLHIAGFRSLADVEIKDLPGVSVLIGANGSGKSNLIRFFEMMSWMLKARRLGEFITLQGGADDQLFRGDNVSRRMDATVTMRTDAGRNEYRFALAHAHPDRFMFVDEAFRFNRASIDEEQDWFHLGSGHTEARILETAQIRRAGRSDSASHSHAVAELFGLPVSRHLPWISLQEKVGRHRQRSTAFARR